MSPDDHTSNRTRHSHSTSRFNSKTARATAAVLACLIAAACSETPLAAPKLPIAQPAHADLLPPPSDCVTSPNSFGCQDQIVDLVVPFRQSTEPNPCWGEDVLLQGNQNAHFDVSTSSDGTLHIAIEFNTQGVKGVGVPSGANYVSATTADWIWNIQGPPPIDQTYIVNTHLIRQGEATSPLGFGDDFFFNERLHVTVNAQGVPTAVIDEADSDCR